MKNAKPNNHGPVITEPTSAEIIKTIEAVKKKYDVIISREDAISFAKLTQELSWWLAVEKGSDSADEITDEIASAAREQLESSRGVKLSKKEAYKKAMESLMISVRKETERIGNEMSEIISKC
jgi:hypothetical protein